MTMSIGKRVRRIRRSADLTQGQLAQRAGVNSGTLARLEQGGIQDPHFSTLEKLAGALDVKIEQLYNTEIEETTLIAGAPGKDEAPEAGPLSPEWAHRANRDEFQLRIRHVASEELRALGEALLKDFYRVRTLDELREEGPAPEHQRARAFSLAGTISEELLNRGEGPLGAYVLAFKNFEKALSSGVVVAREDEVQEHQAG